MKQVDLVIRGAMVVSPTATIAADVAIDGERIVGIAAGEASPPARETIDASGLYVLPGAVDSHVHFREPGYDHKENWQTGTAAAACGGTTSVFEMPNTNPPTGTLEALRDKQLRAKAQAHVDYGIYGLLDEDNIDRLEDLVKAGVSGFKCFMGNTFGNLPAPSDGAMLEGFEILGRLARGADEGRRAQRRARASGRAAGDLRDRGGRPGDRVRRMDRGAAAYRA